MTMNILRWTILLALAGCSSTPASSDAGTDTPDGSPTDALTCSAGQVPAYRAGCTAPVPYCTPDGIGDALALVYCGCDGVDFTWSAASPRRPWARAGSCAGDGGAPPTDVP